MPSRPTSRPLRPVLVGLAAIGLALAVIAGVAQIPRGDAPGASQAEAPVGVDGEVLALTSTLESAAATLSGSVESAAPKTQRRVSVPGRSRVGFSPGFSIIDLSPAALRRDLQGMRNIGARRIRIDLSWARVQPRRGSFVWRDTDRVIEAADNLGLKVTAVLGYEARWARRYDGNGDLRPVNPRAFARFANKAARRYAPMVDSWEIWNEPNLERFWSSGPDAAAYARLVDAVAPVLQRRDPRATVIAGALSPGEDVADGSQISPVTFLVDYYRAAKKKRAVDAISVHPYSYPALPTGRQPWNTFRRLREIRQVMRANGQKHKRVWLTEYGAPTGRHPRAVTTARQGRMLAQGYKQAKRLGFVGPIFFYSYRDESLAPNDLEANFGIVRKNGSRKASYYSLARALRAPNRKN